MDGQAAGAADEDAFLAGDAPRGKEGILVADFHPVIDQGRVEGARPEVLADPLDLVGVHVVRLGVDAPLRVGADDLDRWVVLLEVLGHAGDGAASADAGHEVGDSPAALLPDLGAGRLVMRAGVHRVEVLVRLERVRHLACQAVGHRVIAFGRVALDRGWRGDHLGAVGAQEGDFLRGDLVRHDEDAGVTLDRRGDRQPDAGVAAGRLDNRPARFEPPLALGFLDHADADAVLYRAAGVQHLQFGGDRRADPFGHPVQSNQGCVPERVDDVLADIAWRGNGGCSHRVTPDRKNEEQPEAAPDRG